ncbi:aldo/keto reductase [Microbacterium tumbae]
MTTSSPPNVHPDRLLGEHRIGPIAIGTAGWSFAEDRDDERSLEAAAAALEAGVTLFDTALAYTTADRPAHSDELVGEALRRAGADADPVVSAKGGHYRDATGFPVDGRPETIRRNLDTTLRAVGMDSVHLYSLHHIDTDVPLEESVGAIAELREAGKVEHVGVSNFDVAQLARARAVTRIDAVQNRMSPFDRSSIDVAADLERHGGLFLAYSPGGAPADGSADRALAVFAEIAREREASARRVALAWLLGLSPVIVPIAGSTRPATIVDSAAARELVLTEEERARIDATL